MVDTWQEVNNRVLELTEKGQIQEALETARLAVEAAKREYGTNDRTPGCFT